MRELWRWWNAVPGWAKPVLLTAAIAAVLGIAKGVPAMIRWLVNRRRNTMRESVLKIFEDHPSAMIQDWYLAERCSNRKLSKIKPILRELQNQDLIHRFGDGWRYGPKPKGGGRLGLY